MLGRIISHYRIVEPLGGGGMGVVYKAEDIRLGRFVALKFLQQEFAHAAQFIERFRREARAASSLNHPHICTIYEVDEENGDAFIAMELLEGQPLNQVVRAGPLDIGQLLELAIQISDALEVAHSKGIIHRDIKPANIFVTDRRQAKILDFGLSKQTGTNLNSPDETAMSTDATAPELLTNPGAVVGTVSYIAPEMAKGTEADARSDLFSFGAVLYEMATGRQAFSGATAPLIFDAVLNRTPVSPRQINPEVPQRLEEIIFKALRKDRELRYQYAGDLRADLKQLQRDLDSGVASGTAVAGTARRQQSMAVLPFVDMSAARDQEYFCEGMAEELINALANIEGLRVISRTSAFQFKKQDLDICDIGQRLKVDTVLEGSVRKSGNRLRITVKLVEVSNGYQMWSEKYDRDMEDVFAIQDEIARTIVDKLKIQLSGGQGRPLVRKYTENLEAYNLYLKGRFYWNKRYEVGIQKGMECFQQAIEKDPQYALAYTGLADSYSVLSTYNFLNPIVGYGRAKEAALKALELDDTLAEAHTSVGYIRLFHDWDWEGTESSLRRAIEINPSYAVAHYWYAVFLALRRRFDEAQAEGKRALDLDPLSPLVSAMMGWVLMLARRNDTSIAQLRSALEIDPNSYVVQSFLGVSYAQVFMFDDAVAMLQRAVESTRSAKLMLQGLSIVNATAGRIDEARATIAQLQQRTDSQYLSPFYLACAYALMNEDDHAIACLEQGYSERDGGMAYLDVFPALDTLRADRRFQELLRRMKFVSSMSRGA